MKLQLSLCTCPDHKVSLLTIFWLLIVHTHVLIWLVPCIRRCMALTKTYSHYENYVVCVFVRKKMLLSPSGPTDFSLQWHSNGRRLETSIREYRHALSGDTVLVSSWVREEPLGKDTQYQCSAVSRAGNDTSKIDLRLSSGGNEQCTQA